MRRWSIVPVLVIVCSLALVSTSCGSSASGPLVEPDTQSPEEILTASYEASYALNSACGTFGLNVTFDADMAQVPSDSLALAEMLVDGGIDVTGSFAYSNEPLLADCTLNLTMMGESVEAGFKMAADTFWMRLGDQWYESPAEFTEMFEEYAPQVDPEEITQLIDELGFDPVTWMTGLTFVGEETMDGVTVAQLEGGLDLMKIVSDSFQLLESEEFLELIDPTGTLSSQMTTPGAMPTTADLEEMRLMIESMLSGMVLDLWVGEPDAMMRKMSLTGRIEPPPGEDPEGLFGIDLNMSMSLTGINQTPEIEPPASALPFAALEQAIEDDPQLLGPLSELFSMPGYGGYPY